jgi:integrase
VGVQRRRGRDGATVYRIRWLDHTGKKGKRQSATFAREADAKAALRLRQVETAQRRAGLMALPVEAHTFDDLAAYYLKHRAAKSRHGGRDDRGTIALHLAPVLAGVDVRKIGTEEIDAVTARMEEARYTVGGKNHGDPDPNGRPYKIDSIRRALGLLGSLLKLAVELTWIDRAPLVRRPSAPSQGAKKAWLRTDREIARFLQAARELDEKDEVARANGRPEGRSVRTHARGLHALYGTAVLTGMRLGELAALRWTDVDLENGRITVGRSHDRGTTKGGRVRKVPILYDLDPILRAWKLRSSGPLVFPTTAGTQRGEEDRVWQDWLHATLERAEIPRVDADGLSLSFHSLRHSFASHQVMGGTDLVTLMEIGGWRSLATLQIYSHMSPSAFEKARGAIRIPTLPADGAPVTPLHGLADGTQGTDGAPASPTPTATKPARHRKG